MNTVKIIGENLKNIPWQDKPEGAVGPVWRHSENPVVKRNPAEGIARIFNSAVVSYEGSFLGVLYGEDNGL
ncbi:Beta-1,4-mannooligosaccharide phosphorylase [compost metagenome]